MKPTAANASVAVGRLTAYVLQRLVVASANKLRYRHKGKKPTPCIGAIVGKNNERHDLNALAHDTFLHLQYPSVCPAKQYACPAPIAPSIYYPAGGKELTSLMWLAPT